jgi:hypothetical protein
LSQKEYQLKITLGFALFTRLFNLISELNIPPLKGKIFFEQT